MSLIDIPVYTSGDRPLYPRLQTNILGNSIADRYSYTLLLTGIRVCTPDGYTLVQCSLQSLPLVYFVTDCYSGPGERLLYPKLQTDTLGYSVADRALYSLSLTDIPVYTFGDRPLYPGLRTDTPVYSVAYRSWFTLLLTNILVYCPCDRPL